MPVTLNQNSPVVLVPTQHSDLEDLVAIRIEAMRESLERVGRFDPSRHLQIGLSTTLAFHISL